MSTSAYDIITASFADCGTTAIGENLEAAMAQDGLNKLNRMVSGWLTQYGTVRAINRLVFPLVANQQTYTIGLGGDFNVPRPLTVVGAGLWLNALASPATVTSITRSGFAATVTLTAHGLTVGQQTLIQGATPIDYNGLQTIETVPTANTFTFSVDSDTAVTPATGTITSSAVSGQPVEIPRVVITDDAYQAIQIKNLSNAQFTNVYYNTTFPLGTIFLWPCPNTAQNQLVLYLQDTFTGFADLHTAYDFPDTPGYTEALQYNLDLRLFAPYGVNDPAIISPLTVLAMQSLGNIKRANNKLSDLPSDASLLTHDWRGGYNIQTGTGG